MHQVSDIDQLVVAHWPKDGRRHAETGSKAANRSGDALFLDTCLRRLSIDLSPAGPPFVPQYVGAEIRSGVDAYGFMLEITTGLRSAVPGETNVFGQFKNAWLKYRCDGPATRVARLAPLVHRLINDTKAIRAEHLQGIGGSSYGSLVRRLIAPSPDERILFVGAGNLARSMWPLFRHYELGLWNRHVIETPACAIDTVFSPKHGRAAAKWADHVILTTPPDRANDEQWRTRLDASRARTVVHLGHRRGDDRDAWPGRVAVYDLDDVFALRSQQADIRSRGLTRARADCRRRAALFVENDHRLPFATGAVRPCAILR